MEQKEVIFYCYNCKKEILIQLNETKEYVCEYCQETIFKKKIENGFQEVEL